MTNGGPHDLAIVNALKRQKELQETIKAATDTIKSTMQELEKLKQFIDLYRSLSTGAESESKGGSDSPAVFKTPHHAPVSTKLKGHAHGQTQAVFDALALDILRDVKRPMKSTEFIEEFRNRGQPLGGNEVRTAWNRLWQAKKAGLLTYEPKLGYWIPGEPITAEMERSAIEAAQRTRGKAPSLRGTRGKPKGPPRALTPEQVEEAERLLLSGKSRKEVCELFGGISMATLAGYVGRTDDFLAKHPGVVIPKRPYVPRPYRPGEKPRGKPPLILTAEQETQLRELRDQGKTVREILEITGLKRGTVYKALDRLGAVKKSSQ